MNKETRIFILGLILVAAGIFFLFSAGLNHKVTIGNAIRCAIGIIAIYNGVSKIIKTTR